MKKHCLVLFVCIIALLIPSANAANADENKFFYCMYNGSQFVYKADEDGNITFEPMLASNGDVVSPMIIDDRTYLPFRYVFEEIFGFEDITGQKEQISDETFYYHFSEDGISLTFMLSGGTVKTINLNSRYQPSAGGDVVNILKMENGVTYIALAYFNSMDLRFNLKWDAETGSVYLSDHNDYYCLNCFNKLKEQKLLNNYMTYTDALNNGDTVISVSDVVYGDAYSASSNFNIAAYCSKDRKVCYKDLSNDNDKGQILEIKGAGSNLLVDRLTICGDRLYGLDVTEDGNMKGRLFTSKLKARSYTDRYGDSKCEIYADEFKPLTDTKGVTMFDIEANNAGLLNTRARDAVMNIYYVDADDDYSLNKISLKNADIYQITEPEKITVAGDALKKIDYFAVESDISSDSIQPRSIVYNDFNSATVKYGKFEGSDITDVSEIENIQAIDFIIYDSGMYYYIAKDKPNRIEAITAHTGESRNIMKAKSGEEFSRMFASDAQLFVRIKGKLTRVI